MTTLPLIFVVPLPTNRMSHKEILEMAHIEDVELDQYGNFSESEHGSLEQRDLYLAYAHFDIKTTSSSYDEFTVAWKVATDPNQVYSIELIPSDQRVWDRKGLKSDVAYKQKIWPGSGDAMGQGSTTFNRHVMRQNKPTFKDGTYLYRIVNARGAIVAHTNLASEAVRLGQQTGSIPTTGFAIAIASMDTTHVRDWFEVTWTIPPAYTASTVYLEIINAAASPLDKHTPTRTVGQLCNGATCQTASPKKYDRYWARSNNIGAGLYRVRLVASTTPSASKVILAASTETFRVKTCASQTNQMCKSGKCLVGLYAGVPKCVDCGCGWDNGVGLWRTYCNSVGFFAN